ncbi:MAG: uroporphyrinogen-III synthase [Acidobacteriota bacterium]
MSMLHGRRIALLEARQGEEAAALVEQLGGVAYRVPAVREVVHPEQIDAFIAALSSGQLSIVIFLTGVGVTALLREATRFGWLEATLTALRQTIVACRGPKPMSVLAHHDVPVQVAAAAPYTTRELIAALDSIELAGRTVALVHYGERNAPLAAALERRGARLEELSLYEWQLPEDIEPLRSLVRELTEGRVDAIAFTNEIQCRHLFRVAGDLGLSGQLAAALNTDTIVAVIGPVCADSLQALGVTPDVIPAQPRMGSMVAALAEYFELTEGSD